MVPPAVKNRCLLYRSSRKAAVELFSTAAIQLIHLAVRAKGDGRHSIFCSKSALRMLLAVGVQLSLQFCDDLVRTCGLHLLGVLLQAGFQILGEAALQRPPVLLNNGRFSRSATTIFFTKPQRIRWPPRIRLAYCSLGASHKA